MEMGVLEIEQYMSDFPENARVQIAVKYPTSVFSAKGRMNHTFMAYKNNKIHYVDPQNGVLFLIKCEYQLLTGSAGSFDKQTSSLKRTRNAKSKPEACPILAGLFFVRVRAKTKRGRKGAKSAKNIPRSTKASGDLLLFCSLF